MTCPEAFFLNDFFAKTAAKARVYKKNLPNKSRENVIATLLRDHEISAGCGAIKLYCENDQMPYLNSLIEGLTVGDLCEAAR